MSNKGLLSAILIFIFLSAFAAWRVFVYFDSVYFNTAYSNATGTAGLPENNEESSSSVSLLEVKNEPENSKTEPEKTVNNQEPNKEPAKEPVKEVYNPKPNLTFWEVQSVDTMKYSRDLAREKLRDKSFGTVIDQQVKNIAEVGATHVAIATPYDAEFLPMLKRWVASARKYNLKVWFRGNWSGWEKWFEYPSITREEHLLKTKNFISENAALFENGDIFSSCPECENGGPGDPRSTGDVEGYRAFIISEYQTAKSAFEKIGKDVKANYFSMNGDVARLVMDRETTRALGGIVTIDHYVKTSQKLAADIKDLAAASGGNIVLGEFGAPIPDIHGNMSEEEQARWIKDSLGALSETDNIGGVNYWVNVGGSTELWSSDGKARGAVAEIGKFYKPDVAYGTVKDAKGLAVEGAKLSYGAKTFFTDKNGYFEFPYVGDMGRLVTVSSAGFADKEIDMGTSINQALKIVLDSK